MQGNRQAWSNPDQTPVGDEDGAARPCMTGAGRPWLRAWRPAILALSGMANAGVALSALFLAGALAIAVVVNLQIRLDQVIVSLAFLTDLLALAGLCALLAAGAAAWRFGRGSPGICVGLASGVFVAAGLVSALLVEPEWISDFATMWGRAASDAHGHFAVTDIFDQRIQLLLVPALKLFGAHTWLVPALNVACLVTALLLGAWWAARVAGPAGLLIFCLAFASTPELQLAVGIPTHDVWGLPFLALATVAVHASIRRCREQAHWSGICAWVVIAGVSMTLLQIQREIGHVAFIAGIATYAVLATSRAADHAAQEAPRPSHGGSREVVGLLCCMLILGLTYPAGLAASRHLGMVAGSQSDSALADARIGGIAPSTSQGSYANARAFVDNFLATVEPETRSELVRDIALSDAVLQPERRVPNVLLRLKSLSPMGSQIYFYLPGLDADAPRANAWLTAMAGWHAAAFALLTLLALLRMAIRGTAREYLFPVLFSTFLLAALALVGETQPRYLIPLWFSGALIISSFALGTSGVRASSRRRWWTLACIPAVLLLVHGAWRIADASYSQESGRVLDAWQPAASAPGSRPPLPSTAYPALVGDHRSDPLGDLAFALQLPTSREDRVAQAVETELCVADTGRFEFHYYMPYHQDYALGHFTLSLLVDGVSVWSTGLPATPGIQYAAVDMDRTGCSSLQFQLSTDRGIADESWSSASLTEIYFPRFSAAATEAR